MKNEKYIKIVFVFYTNHYILSENRNSYFQNV